MNLLPDGFLSEDVLQPWIKGIRAATPEWFALVGDINRSAVHILTRLSPSRSSDREMVAAALFARAVQSFEASILLAERGMLADAGSLARNVVESTILLGGAAYVEGFPRQLASNNNAHYYGMAKAIAEQLEQWGDDDQVEDASSLRGLLSQVDEQGHRKRPGAPS
ncbi:DUF5677 domain-containing protein [Ralstonia sp. ASV6]|uniref:DUF5677 domain-containing protein n=1 Tax=Ralstonia sp. ASV6 TaxID=2795124 RepID=UPI0018EBE641|nr:DUF5677 domain-containing protein [Ralstonia sp. ASV6]